MTLPTGYATIAEADVILAANAAWLALDDATKNDHLSWAKVYIDDTYSCLNMTDELGEYYSEIKTANSLLAEANMGTSIFERQSENGPLEEVEVRAGSVLSRERYSTRGRVSWRDPFPKISALLAQLGCKITKSTGSTTVPLIRG